jgi:hypothetical protein
LLTHRNTQNGDGDQTAFVPSADVQPATTVLVSPSQFIRIFRPGSRTVGELGRINRVSTRAKKSLARHPFLGETPANKSLDASGGSVFRIIIGWAMLE